MMFMSITRDENPKWLLLLTSWNYLAETVLFIFSSAVTLRHVIAHRHKDGRMELETLRTDNDNCNSRLYGSHEEGESESITSISVLDKLYWLLHSTILVICTEVTVIYWALLHDYKRNMALNLRDYLLIDRHGINLILLVIDFSVSKTPVRILHAVYPMLFGTIYTAFNVGYYTVTGEEIYPILDYANKPGLAFAYIAGGILVVTPLCQHFWYCAYRLRKRLLS